MGMKTKSPKRRSIKDKRPVLEVLAHFGFRTRNFLIKYLNEGRVGTYECFYGGRRNTSLIAIRYRARSVGSYIELNLDTNKFHTLKW